MEVSDRVYEVWLGVADGVCGNGVGIPFLLAIFPQKVSVDGVGPRAGKGQKAHLHLSIPTQN